MLVLQQSVETATENVNWQPAGKYLSRQTADAITVMDIDNRVSQRQWIESS
jgi:hypothetical protein